MPWLKRAPALGHYHLISLTQRCKQAIYVGFKDWSLAEEIKNYDPSFESPIV
jgi:hypothetical protein